MATYLELFGLISNSNLQDRVTVACMIAAEAVRTAASPPANQAKRLTWAAAVMHDPKEESVRMLRAVLASNASATVAQITGATDAQLQAKVDAAIDLFAGT